MIIPICLASDRNYLQHLSVTMASILKNKTPEDLIRFYILENDFTEADKQTLTQLKSITDFEIEYIEVKNKIIENLSMNAKDRLTIETYFRLFIPELIPQENKVIYLDCDIVVKSSLSELYSLEMPENTYILGVRDIDQRNNARRMSWRGGVKKYINAGVLVMNSKRMRENMICQKFIDFILNNKERIVWHDQDVINGTLQEHIRYISPIWNGQIGRFPKNMKYSRLHDARILHYIGDKKPWLPYKNSTFTEEYFTYLRLTPFFSFEKNYKKHRFLYKLSLIPVFLSELIFKKITSPRKTYNTYRLFGIPFKRKRKRGWKRI